MTVEKITVPCAFCGKDVTRYPSQIKGKRAVFCSRPCAAKYSRKDLNPEKYAEYRDFTNNAARFSELARKNNPTKMTPEVREKLRNARLGAGEGKGYGKLYGKLEHRAVVEQALGRELRSDEVVHHKDGNKRNNTLDNLQVMTQAEHTRLHAHQRREAKQKEVMPDEVRTA